MKLGLAKRKSVLFIPIPSFERRESYPLFRVKKKLPRLSHSYELGEYILSTGKKNGFPYNYGRP
jgi:hypothetical protein